MNRPSQIFHSPHGGQAAAIVAAIERFMRATAPNDDPGEERPWPCAQLSSKASRARTAPDVPDPWINTQKTLAFRQLFLPPAGVQP